MQPSHALESEGLSVVIRGFFNPAIITPGWLAKKKLIGDLESENPEEQTIVPQASVFALNLDPPMGWV